MTLTKYNGAYEELFSNCVWYSDGSLNGSYLANLVNSSLYGTITGATKTGNDRFGNGNRCYVNASYSEYISIPLSIEPTTTKTILFWIKTRSSAYGNAEQGGYFYDSGAW